VLYQAWAGDPVAAKACAALIPDSGLRTTAHENVVCAYVAAGDLPGAKAQADSIPDSIPDAYHRVNSYADIVEGQIKAKDLAGARETVRTMSELAPTISDAKRRGWSYINTARAQAMLGDLPGVQRSLEAAPVVGEDSDMRDYIYQQVAFASLGSGDIASAKAATKLPVFAWRVDPRAEAYVASQIARTQARMGDFVGARAALTTIADKRFRAEALLGMAQDQARAGQLEALEAWIASLKDPWDRVSGYLGAAQGLLPPEREPKDSDRFLTLSFGRTAG